MTVLCEVCGASPCYHICPNSPHFYSPEQERYDDQFYGEDDHRERYAATAEPSQYADDDAGYAPVVVSAPVVDFDAGDIPF